MKEKYESLALVQLRELAKVRGLKGTSSMKKAELVEAMLAEDFLAAQERPRAESRPGRERLQGGFGGETQKNGRASESSRIRSAADGIPSAAERPCPCPEYGAPCRAAPPALHGGL